MAISENKERSPLQASATSKRVDGSTITLPSKAEILVDARLGVAWENLHASFGNLKRQIHGTHHHVSKKHLPRYLEEFDYKFNTREMDDGARTTAAMMRISTAKRVTLYKSKSGGDSLFDRGRPKDGEGKRKRKAKRKAGRQSRAHARKRGPRYGPANED